MFGTVGRRSNSQAASISVISNAQCPNKDHNIHNIENEANDLAFRNYDGEMEAQDVIVDTDEEDINQQQIVDVMLNGNSPKQKFIKRVTQRRLARNQVFSSWLDKKVEHWKDESNEKELGAVEDEKLSAKLLIHHATKIISEPREYQLELFEIAKQRNCLAVLDTGSGKTLIACLLIRHMITQELEARTRGAHRRVSFFLVDSVTLVFQQAAVLDCNIDAKVGKYYGDMCESAKMWKQQVWTNILDEDQVIVMTADILYNLLTHAFVNLADINLLCFDEAHHAKKNHVYARIVREFYLPEPEKTRPKIFGLTASPVDARVDVVRAATELEMLLHSRIITTSDLSLLQSSLRRPEEQIMKYPKLKNPFETSLCQYLRSKYGDIPALRKIFIFAKEATAELGSWCADHVWSFALSETETHKITQKVEKIWHKQDIKTDIEKIEAEVERIREARQMIESHSFLEPKFSQEDTSTKVLLLRKFLQKIYCNSDTQKCIIFVRRRYTARCLYDILDGNVCPNVRLAILVGSRKGETGDETFTFRQQMLNVSRFRRGKLNCLIATSVAEEGLDVPDCNVVIRFDLYSTMIQYIQSRGRARHSTSRYLHMYEIGNSDQLRIIKDCLNAESVMRNFCQSLPEDRVLDEKQSAHIADDCAEPFYIESTTGAKLTFSSAQQIISHYVGNLSQEGEDIVQPIYIVRPAGSNQFICELIMPSNSALAAFDGPRMSSKSAAKRAAAFSACLELRRGGYLNEYLLPKFRLKEIPKYANARLAVDVKKTNTYTYRRKPTFWDVDDDTPPAQLWITVIRLPKSGELFLGNTMKPICIATRKKMPSMPKFPIFGTKGGQSNVHLIRLEKPLVLTGGELKLLETFTDRAFFDVFNKHFEFTYNTLRYWLAPLKENQFFESSIAKDIIDWGTLEEVASARELAWNPGDSPYELAGRFLIDRVDRSRRFIVEDYAPEFKPTDPVPRNVSKGGEFENIRDYSYNAGKRKKWMQIKWEIPNDEPVFRAERMLHRLNFLEPPAERDVDSISAALICASNFSVSMFPASCVRSIIIFASISSRVDAYLHAWDLCKILGTDDLDLGLALEAITKNSDNSEQPLEKVVNKQRGMGNNYERLEFLGDCYLKLGTSVSLFCESHSSDEYKLHVERMILICNQNLFEKAKIIGIPDFIQTQGFSRRTWYPEMKLLHGKKTGELAVKNNVHKLGDKSVADVCEAIIGAALLDKGLDGATKMVSSILMTRNHTQQKWTDYYNSYTKPTYELTIPTASQQKLADDIERQFGYKFNSPKLLMSAFTHPSNPYSWEKVPSYQRLEFLGDSLLELACVQHIFNAHPEADPQWLTEHKMAMVSNRFLGAVSVVLGFHKRLRKVGTQLDIAINEYTTDILEAKERSTLPNFWNDLSIQIPPKVLPDILEAFIGAIFVDSEFDYGIVETFFRAHIRPYFVDMTLYDDFAGQHPTTFLTKKLTSLGCENWGWECDQYITEEDNYMIAAIMIHGEVFSWGKGVSAKTARLQASEEALTKLCSMNSDQLRCLCSCTSSKLV
ncbi:hypothetical protein K440DRAFT_584862 [Wilcoxina mikolae CBS 423.85]|nr:hypothetical protein K440DRAFT_584862 [Wilcoxina mikolae CBS 423.85]